MCSFWFVLRKFVLIVMIGIFGVILWIWFVMVGVFEGEIVIVVMFLVRRLLMIWIFFVLLVEEVGLV